MCGQVLEATAGAGATLSGTHCYNGKGGHGRRTEYAEQAGGRKLPARPHEGQGAVRALHRHGDRPERRRDLQLRPALWCSPTRTRFRRAGLHTIEHTIAVLLRERISRLHRLLPVRLPHRLPPARPWGHALHRGRRQARSRNRSSSSRYEGHVGRRSRHNHRKLRQLPRPQPVHRQGVVRRTSSPKGISSDPFERKVV